MDGAESGGGGVVGECRKVGGLIRATCCQRTAPGSLGVQVEGTPYLFVDRVGLLVAAVREKKQSSRVAFPCVCVPPG